MNILLFCDASNLHRCLAEGLRRKGHNVVVASDGNRWMNTERDVDLARPFDNKIGGALLWMRMRELLRVRLRDFDVVSIANSTFPLFVPARSALMLKSLVANNRNLFVNALGTDPLYVKACMERDSPLRYSEWRTAEGLTPYALGPDGHADRWLAPELVDLYRELYALSKGTTTALYEYDKVCRSFLGDENVAYAGIPIDTASIRPVELPERPRRVKLFLGLHSRRMKEKGTDRILAAAKRVVERYPDRSSLDIVENLPYADYLRRQREAHVVLDQLYSFTPATNALLAMAAGLNTLSGAEPEYYDFIGERELRPIINAVPDDEALYRTLEEVVLHPEFIRQRGLQGREFVEKHNSLEVVTDRYLQFWQSRMGKNRQTFVDDPNNQNRRER